MNTYNMVDATYMEICIDFYIAYQAKIVINFNLVDNYPLGFHVPFITRLSRTDKLAIMSGLFVQHDCTLSDHLSFTHQLWRHKG